MLVVLTSAFDSDDALDNVDKDDDGKVVEILLVVVAVVVVTPDPKAVTAAALAEAGEEIEVELTPRFAEFVNDEATPDM